MGNEAKLYALSVRFMLEVDVMAVKRGMDQ